MLMSEHVNLKKAWAGGRLGSGFFVLHLPTLGIKGLGTEAKTERTATRGPRNPARLTNSFNFVHETRSLRFPFACESENVLEENVGRDRGPVMDVHGSGSRFTETGAVRRWPPPCWRSGPVLGCLMDIVRQVKGLESTTLCRHFLD